jgi:hypothetical protein
MGCHWERAGIDDGSWLSVTARGVDTVAEAVQVLVTTGLQVPSLSFSAVRVIVAVPGWEPAAMVAETFRPVQVEPATPTDPGPETDSMVALPPVCSTVTSKSAKHGPWLQITASSVTVEPEHPSALVNFVIEHPLALLST